MGRVQNAETITSLMIAGALKRSMIFGKSSDYASGGINFRCIVSLSNINQTCTKVMKNGNVRMECGFGTV